MKKLLDNKHSYENFAHKYALREKNEKNHFYYDVFCYIGQYVWAD